MNELIKNIKGIHDFRLTPDSYTHFSGYEVETDCQKILVLVDQVQSCCESAGYLSTPDDPKEFVGAQLRKVEIVDQALSKEAWDKEHPYGLDRGGVVFVNFETDQGLFQLAVYNSHNGYYGHDARVVSRDLNYEEVV